MESQNNFTCTYCDKSFQRERTLQVHMCEPKRRHLQKSEKWVQNAYIVFRRFYEIHQKNGKQNHMKTSVILLITMLL